MKNSLRTLAALALVAITAGSAQVPICFTEACPMSAAEREVCQEMGRECCQAKGGGVVHAPTLDAPLAALAAFAAIAPGLHAAEVLASAKGGGPKASLGAPLAPALLQGVGLFTLHSVFLI